MILRVDREADTVLAVGLGKVERWYQAIRSC